MIDVLSLDNMIKSDKYTCENVINSKELMYNAGYKIYNAYDYKGKIGIVCGTGNNAGDGYVLASLLKKDNKDVKLLLIKNNFSVDSKYYFDLCLKSNISYEIIDENTSFDYDILVDSIFGTGFKGKVENPYDIIFEKYNNSNAFKISVDINSGLNGETGIGDKIIKSDLTLAISHYKPGHFLNMAKDYIKDLKVLDIGIKPLDNPYHLIELNDFKGIINDRLNYSNKGDYGYTTLIGGSLLYSGAIKLSSLSSIALRMGCGVSIIACPKDIKDYVLPYVLESTIYPLSSNDGFVSLNRNELDYLINRTKSITIGMGLGSNDDTYNVLEYIILNYNKTLIIDADGLNLLSKNIDLLNKTKAKIILTPHIKEFSRLIKKDINEILDDEINLAKDFARKYDVILLLKGPTTIITDGKNVNLVNKGTSGMATAGSGDVLSGIISGLSGYMDDLLMMTSLASYINGLAGEMASKANSNITMVASDTINNIKLAYEYIIKNIK